MRNSQDLYTEEDILSKFNFDQNDRKFECLDQSLGKLLIDYRIGAKIPTIQNQNQHQHQHQHPNPDKNTHNNYTNNYKWSVFPQQFIYLVSCLNMPSQLIFNLYAQLTPVEIDRTIFYIWMRKRSRLVKIRDRDRQVYSIFSTFQAYNADKPAYTIKVFQSGELILGNFGSQTEEKKEKDREKEVKKGEWNKIAIVRNRDIIIFDVIP